VTRHSQYEFRPMSQADQWAEIAADREAYEQQRADFAAQDRSLANLVMWLWCVPVMAALFIVASMFAAPVWAFGLIWIGTPAMFAAAMTDRDFQNERNAK